MKCSWFEVIGSTALDGGHAPVRDARAPRASRGGRAESDASGRTLLPVRNEAQDRGGDGGKRRGGGVRRRGESGNGADQGGAGAAGCTQAACVLCVGVAGMLRRCGLCPRMAMCMCTGRGVIVRMFRCGLSLHARMTLRARGRGGARHDRRHGAPHGDQHGKQQQKADAHGSHGGKASRLGQSEVWTLPRWQGQAGAPASITPACASFPSPAGPGTPSRRSSGRSA